MNTRAGTYLGVVSVLDNEEATREPPAGLVAASIRDDVMEATARASPVRSYSVSDPESSGEVDRSTLPYIHPQATGLTCIFGGQCHERAC